MIISVGIVLVVFIVGAVAAYKVIRVLDAGRVEASIVVSILFLLLLLLAPLAVAGVGMFTGGVMPGYSAGSRTGYITKISQKGMFWQTHEAEMQVGTGQMAALQEPFKFSIVDEHVLKVLSEIQGTETRVTVQYNQWLVQPLWRGRSGYEVVTVEKDQN